MRILLALDRLFPPQRVGGVESNADDLANALHLRGTSVAVLARLNLSDRYGIFAALRRTCLGGRLLPDRRGHGYPIYRSPMLTRDLPTVLRHFRPQVAVVQAVGKLGLARLLHQHRIPTVLHFHDVEFAEPVLPFTPAGVIANSQFTAERVEQQYSLTPTTILNIFDAKQYRAPHLGQHVTFINPVKKKGSGTAFALAEQNPDIPFMFVEGWPLEPKARKHLLRQIAQHPNIAWQPRTHDMRKVYGATKILLVPSLCEESWGRVVSEAQINAIPVLASNVGGLPEAVGPGGVLLPSDDLPAWQRALRSVWDDDAKWNALSANGQTHAARRALDPDHIVDQYIDTLTL